MRVVAKNGDKGKVTKLKKYKTCNILSLLAVAILNYICKMSSREFSRPINSSSSSITLLYTKKCLSVTYFILDFFAKNLHY